MHALGNFALGQLAVGVGVERHERFEQVFGTSRGVALGTAPAPFTAELRAKLVRGELAVMVLVERGQRAGRAAEFCRRYGTVVIGIYGGDDRTLPRRSGLRGYDRGGRKQHGSQTGVEHSHGFLPSTENTSVAQLW